jgi:hypothetical protein
MKAQTINMLSLTNVRSIAAFRNLAADFILCLITIVYALPTLLYPYGRDQGIFHYVGREWLNGLLPYRDLFDQKPPGIHIVYAMAHGAVGNRMIGIRIFELLGIFVMGWLISRAFRSAQDKKAGEFGAATLLTAGWYFTSFDYWSTAQVELWESLFLLGAFIIAERSMDRYRAAVVSGICAGVAFLFKFPSIVVSSIIAVYLVVRFAWLSKGKTPFSQVKQGLLALILFGAGACAPIMIVTFYFLVHGGINSLVDILIEYNKVYLQKYDMGIEGMIWRSKFFLINSWPMLSLIVFLWASGCIRSIMVRDKPSISVHLWSMAAVLAAYVSVIIQKKFYLYHWIIITPFIILCWYYGASLIARYWKNIFPVSALVLVGTGLLFPPSWGSYYHATYRQCTAHFWNYVLGREPRDTFLEGFTIPRFYNYKPQEHLSEIIKTLAVPEDTLHVYGCFEPAFYILTGVSSPSRFFAEFALLDSKVTYRRNEWLKERDEALKKSPPRFIICFTGIQKIIQARLGTRYKNIAQEERFVLLERYEGVD